VGKGGKRKEILVPFNGLDVRVVVRAESVRIYKTAHRISSLEIMSMIR
jgi:hypothetical protein